MAGDRRGSILLLVPLLLRATAAVAADPPTVPERDVDVQYDLAGRTAGGPPQQERIRWAVAAGKMRVDPPTPGLYLIADYRTGHAQVVKPAEKAVMEIDQASPFLLHRGAPLVALGSDQVAGLPCTNFQTPDTSGRPTTLCLTADGVMLRASYGDQVLVEAKSVTYGPQNAADFATPEGFRHVAPGTP